MGDHRPRAFVQRVAQLAHVLADAGVVPGHRVIHGSRPKGARCDRVVRGCGAGRVVYLPLNTAYTEANWPTSLRMQNRS